MEQREQDLRIQLQQFVAKLNQQPNEAELDEVPGGNARTLPISFVEMTLDEMFFGLWETSEFKWSVIQNEVIGSIQLTVTNPINGQKYTRTGAGAIQIMVDKAPDNAKGQQRNEWYLNPSNKKPNALDMGFPKLKAECMKNAALSLGKLFGRDINRKKQDDFKKLLYPIPNQALEAALSRVKRGEPGVLALCESNFLLTDEQREMLLTSEPHKQLNGTAQ